MESASVVTQDQHSTTGGRWCAEVFVSLKPVVNDPQGLAVREGLHMLGYEEVSAVRAGKYLQLWLDAPDQRSAEERVRQMCEKLLANPVIEQYHFRLSQDSDRQIGN
jgi:phosphoribosylformylglycinamidine synthase